MKKSVKGFVLGLIVATLLMSTVFGAGVQKTIDVVFDKVNVEVNGNAVEGENILYDGTTYVPLRAIGEMLDKEIGWNGDTNTASIDDKGAASNKKREEPNNSGATLSQKNAVKKAEQYISIMPHSKEGLKEQLEFEGFETEDAIYAVNNIEVDWKEQAVKKGENYLDIMAYSRNGLLEQLEFEGFTEQEAIYALDQIGL